MDRPKTALFFLLDSEPEEGAFCICDAGIEQCAPDYAFGPHIRDYFLLHFVLEGKGVLRRADGGHPVAAGQAFLIRPDELTVYAADHAKPWRYAWLGWRGVGAKEFCDRRLGNACVFDAEPAFLLEIERVYRTETDPRALALQAHALLFRFAAELYARAHGERAETRSDVVRNAVAWIENNYFRTIDIGRLASQTGLSRAHFSTVFSSVMGTSPYRYLTRFRIAKAQQLLVADPSLTAAEVAYAVGFSTPARFCEMFGKVAGTTPTAFRRNVLDGKQYSTRGDGPQFPSV